MERPVYRVAPRVTELLRDKPVCSSTLGVLCKMKRRRQIEAAELMVLAGNYSRSYARGLLMTTDRSELVPHRRGRRADLSFEQIARFKIEMNAVEGAFRIATETYGG